MLNFKLKLQGLPLDEIINEGVHGNNPEVSVDDWKYIESLFSDYLTPEEVADKIQAVTEDMDTQLEDTALCNYETGLSDEGSDERELKRLQTILKENNIDYS
ncbi:hypothetical protein VPHF94_0186 [Vibrio phage F94]